MTETKRAVLVIGSALGRHIYTHFASAASNIPVMIVEGVDIAERAAALLDAQHAFREQIVIHSHEIHAALDPVINDPIREDLKIGRKGKNRRKW